MARDFDKQKTFSRRAVVFGGLQGAAFSALVGRLFYLQFLKADEFSMLSENNRIKLQLLAPERGRILDRIGIPMALNDKNYRLFIDGNGLGQKAFLNVVEQVNALVPLGDKKMAQLRKTRGVPVVPELLKEHLSWDEVSLLELHLLELPGVSIDIGQVRAYPLSEDAAHLIGYVGAVAESDLTPDSGPLMRLPDFKIGKNGVEQMLESTLQGKAGIRQIEVNVHGVPVREVSRRESEPGQNMMLTIDSELQEFASNLVRKESAAVVLMEVDTGNVLTLVSLPAFDPNSFSQGISNEYWKKLSTDKKVPLMNKAISGQYPPGSTFKMMVGLAGLDNAAIRPWSTVYCPGHYMLGDHQFNCWKEGGHGTVNYHQAVEQSCDTFFYTVANELGIDAYADMSRRFGLGDVHDIGLIGEKPGIMPDPEWKMKRYKQKWTGGDTINCSIGQGYVLSTPLQLAVMTARIATGRAIEPRLWVAPGEEHLEYDSLEIKSDYLELTREAMSAVSNSPSGTAYGHRISEARFAMGGKTGTSQVRKILQRGVNQATIPWEYRHHALFVGFAPVDKPKYACCVVVEHGGGGAAAAAPVAKAVLLKVQQLEEERAGIKPPAPAAS